MHSFPFNGGKIQFSTIFVEVINKEFGSRMRIDKYLWCTRYYKTRNQATEACKKGHVKVNDQVVKPSREVFPSDKISVRKKQVDYQLMVLEIPDSRVGAKIVDLYRTDTTSAEAFRHQEVQKLAREYYRKKGTGRPTKKDRRNIDDYLDEGE
jgi:ribosome-associated heat shock protein Hsp15